MDNSKEDQLLRSALAKTADCLPLEKLESPDPHVRAHLDRCAYCQNELAMLVEFRDATARTEEVADLAWMQSELKRRMQPAPRALPSRSFWSAASEWWERALPSRAWQAALAACVLLLAGGGMYLRQTGDGLRPPSGEQVWRSQTVSTVAPVGDLAGAPADLQWQATPGAGKYLVRLMEVDRTEIWRTETPGTQVAIPAAVRAQMTPGRSFLWIVTARDGTGSTLAESALQTFHISATSH